MDYYLEENVIKTTEHTHDNYKLVIKTYDTKKVSGKSTWDYTQGFIYNNDVFVGSIKRNYGSFPFCFFNHYLVSGRNYQRQTIIDCDNGQIYDNTDDPDADDFCWSSIGQLDNRTLYVQGCYWGAGYEYKFFDVSDVSKGWPELKVEAFISNKWYDQCLFETKESVENNVLTLQHYDYNDDDSEELCNEPNIIIKLQRDGDMIKIVDLTLSDTQKQIEYDRDVKKKEDDVKKQVLIDDNIFYQQLLLAVNLHCSQYRIYADIALHNYTFNIDVYYKKCKACCVSFKTEKVNMTCYDWRIKGNTVKCEYEQDVAVIDEIVTKFKLFLQD